MEWYKNVVSNGSGFLLRMPVYCICATQARGYACCYLGQIFIALNSCDTLTISAACYIFHGMWPWQAITGLI